MLADLIHLSRTIRRSPASAVAAIVTLALTLGAGASIFAVVDAILLTPPPFANPDALVTIGETPMDEPLGAPRNVRYAVFEAWRERAGSLAAIEASDGTNLILTELGAPERILASNVTPGFLPLLGITPVLGRSFTADDVAQPVAIVSDAFWRGTLAADPGVIGRRIVLGGQPHTIVGVLPGRLSSALARDVWRPFPVTPARAEQTGYRVGGLARLAPGVSLATLASALDDVSRASSPPARVVITPIATAMVRDAPRTLGLLAGAAALTVLIAFTNLAGLLIVRSIDRRRELAVRSALGAGRWQIARQLLLEAELLVAMGAVGGVLLALWLTPVVRRLALEQFGEIAQRDMSVSWRVIGAVSLLAAVCAAVCGLLPAVVAARQSVVNVLRRGATEAPRELILRRVFVAAQVALAFVLLVSVTLLGRSLAGVLRVNPGFEARGLLTLAIALPAATYPTPERVVSFYSTLQSTLEERLGPSTVSVIDELPLNHDRGRTLVSVQPADPGREAVLRTVAPAYFDVMRIPLLAGREFEATDNASAPPRVVVSESLAQRLFAGESAIGHRVRLAAVAQIAEIIGVVGDVKHRALDEAPLSTVYVSGLQIPSNGSIVVVRSARPDADVIAAVREEVARLDGDLPVYGVRAMIERVAASPGVPARRVLTATFTAFALVAVALGGIGLFGVVAHDVASRRVELALRIALGADPTHILSATVAQGALMVGAGLLAGGVLSIWATRMLGSLVFAAGFDAVTVGAASAVLMLVGACAVLPTARRAARTDPRIAFRSE